MSAAEFRALSSGKNKRNKFGAKRTVVDGESFDSKAEAGYILNLRLLARQGLIKDLRTQVSYDLTINGILICRYVADATFYDVEEKRHRVTDLKGGDVTKTPAFRIKAKLMLALYGVAVECVS